MAERKQAEEKSRDDAGETAAAVETEVAEQAAAKLVPAAALEAAEQKAEEHWNRYLRTAAELENVRKRADRDLENAHKYALERFASELLPVKDSLELGLDAVKVDPGDTESMREGVEMTLRLLASVLERFGIEEIDPAGEPFNPELHEAMATQESSKAAPDSVLSVVQKGYTLNGRLLRPARVMVAREPGKTGGSA